MLNKKKLIKLFVFVYPSFAVTQKTNTQRRLKKSALRAYIYATKEAIPNSMFDLPPPIGFKLLIFIALRYILCICNTSHIHLVPSVTADVLCFTAQPP